MDSGKRGRGTLGGSRADDAESYAMDSFATPDRRPRSTVGSTGGKRSWDSVGRVIPDSDKRIKTGESVAVDSQQEVAESEEDDDVVPVCLRMLFIPHARSTRSSTLNHAAQHPDEPHANGQRALSFFALTRLCPAGYPVPPALNDGALDRVGSMWALLSSLHAQLSSFQSFVKTCLERSLQPRSPILHAPTHSSHALLTLICPIPRSPPLPPSACAAGLPIAQKLQPGTRPNLGAEQSSARLLSACSPDSALSVRPAAAHEKKGAPHVHVLRLPMQQPSNSGFCPAAESA